MAGGIGVAFGDLTEGCFEGARILDGIGPLEDLFNALCERFIVEGNSEGLLVVIVVKHEVKA